MLVTLLNQARKGTQSQEFTRVELLSPSKPSRKLEKSLTKAPALGLPSEPKFHLYVAERHGRALGGSYSTHVPFPQVIQIAKELDEVARPGSSCYCQTPDPWSAKGSLGLPLTVHKCHYTWSF